MSTSLEHVEVDFMFLADRAEVLNGKLYVMGGAWDRYRTNDINTPMDISIVIGVLVPWNLTNKPHQLQIKIEDDDGNPISPSAECNINVGRPVTSTQGQIFRATAVLSSRLTLPKLGAYSVVASIKGQHKKRVIFYAVNPG